MRFVDRIRHTVGREFFVSEPFEVTQAKVDAFAEATGDWDYMHNDPEWAATHGPWGGTIAHGYYLVSLMAHFRGQAGFPTVATADEMTVNYGLNKVRFLEPVLVGDRLRARMRIAEMHERKPGRELVTTEVIYQTERRGDRPHMIAETLTLCVYGEAVAHAR